MERFDLSWVMGSLECIQVLQFLAGQTGAVWQSPWGGHGGPGWCWEQGEVVPGRAEPIRAQLGQG